MKSEEPRFENEYKKDIFFWEIDGADGAEVKKEEVAPVDGEEVQEPEMVLQIDQTATVRVWAIPQECQVYRDELICVVENNPVPEVFAMTCEGQTPLVKLSAQEMVFERILLTQSTSQYLTISNNCKIATNWKLTFPEELPEEFDINPKEGNLNPCGSTEVTITFNAIKQQMFDINF